MTGDSEGDTQRKHFTDVLRAAEKRQRPIAFWWRDDDAETATPALDRLLDLAQRHALPLALAVVPMSATESLAGLLPGRPNLAVLQHGWGHTNHAPGGAKKMELGEHRPLQTVLQDLQRGLERLTALLPEEFLPVLVPPWNRISDRVRDARRKIGLEGLSTFGSISSDDPQWVNTHLDIFAWKPVRRRLSRSEAFARLASEMQRRLAGDPEPVGILTHHLVHDEASWHLLEEILDLTAKHPALRWPKAGEIFQLTARDFGGQRIC